MYLISCFKKKRNVLLNKKVISNFHTIFKINFMTQIIYCIIHTCLYSLFILYKRELARILTLQHS